MSTIKTSDGTSIYYKDWGTGQPVVFSHGWPLDADAWDPQMMFLGERGYRVIAHDRRGHGRSDQTWDGNDMNTYADDLAALMNQLDIKDAVLIGHSTGGGEVTRYLGRHGTSRVAKAILVSAIPPLMLKTPANPEGSPIEVFDELRRQMEENRPQCYLDLSEAFYGYNKPGAKRSEGTKQTFWLQGMLGSTRGSYECIKQFSETDFNEDLKKIDIPTLFLHGDADQIVPIVSAALKSAKLVKGAKLKVYPGAPHGMLTTMAAELNADILDFIRAKADSPQVAEKELAATR